MLVSMVWESIELLLLHWILLSLVLSLLAEGFSWFCHWLGRFLVLCCFLFPPVLCFYHFSFAFLFSLIFSRIACGIVFVCLLVGSGVVVVLVASWIVPVNDATTCYMCSGVFNGMLQFILLSIISLKVCHLMILLHSASELL